MALLAYKHFRDNMNINQSKYLVAPKVVAKGCTWDLLEWPLFLKQLPKTRTTNKMMFLSAEFTTKGPSNNCTSLSDTAVYRISLALSLLCPDLTTHKESSLTEMQMKITTMITS